MGIAEIVEAVQRNAVLVVFVNVLLQQLGLPVPVVPTLLLAGSLALTPLSLGTLLVVAVLASLVADVVWYAAGRLLSYRVLAGLCYLSINPESCVTQTEARVVRWGLPSLVIAKFIPGFSLVAPPIAGALRLSFAGFLLAASVGAMLWAGLAIGAGWLLSARVPDAISLLDRHNGLAALAVVLLLSIWLAWKVWKKHRFRTLADLPTITAAEYWAALEGSGPPRLIDLRGASMIAKAGPIPGAVVTELDSLEHVARDWPRTAPLVTLCACPQDATAVQAARRLQALGFASVRPMKGGYDAWSKEVRSDAKTKTATSVPPLPTGA